MPLPLTAYVAASNAEPRGSTIGIVMSDPELRSRVISALGLPLSLVVSAEDLGALARMRPLPAYDAVVMHMPAAHVSDTLRAIRAAPEELSGVPLVVVAVGAESWLRRLLRAGAVGFVHADRVERALGATVRAALVGQSAVPLSLAHHVCETALSHRERQILELAALGMTNNEIARRFFLAESTVKSHLSAAFRELGVHSRKEAAALVLDPEGGVGTGILGTSSGELPPAEERDV